MSTLFSKAFSGFSVDDLDAARQFYGEVLGLDVSTREGDGGPDDLNVWLALPGTDARVFVYPKGAAHQPASFTVLNFPVPDVAAKVAELQARGVEFEHYAGTPVETDADGVFRGFGPPIAWFKDPAGNVIAVIDDVEA